MYRVLIADDERLARERLKDLLQPHADMEVVGECRNGRDTLAAVHRLHPDVLFLDMEMPEVDGLGVVAGLPAEVQPAVVFVTAYDRYALRAFDVHALDYLLKPFSDSRFTDTLAHLRTQGARPPRFSASMLTLLRTPPAPEPPARLVVRDGTRWHLVAPEGIDWIEGADVYARLVVGTASYLHRASLADLERRLDPARFLRIHRSTIVNLERIVEVRQLAHGDLLVVLHNGVSLRVGRRYADRLRAALDLNG